MMKKKHQKKKAEPQKGGAPKGNQFWKVRSTHGRNPIFKTPDKLWEACCEYFEWVDKHPLTAAELVKYQGQAKIKRVPKMRAMTIGGLCIFLDIGVSTWADYKNREDFSGVTTRVEEIIRHQKFSGAAADLLNPNIIARDLELQDKQSREHTGLDGGPIQWTEGPPTPKTIAEWEKQVKEAKEQE